MARKMPQNLDAEMSVLGVCFLDDKVVSKVLEEVKDGGIEEFKKKQKDSEITEDEYKKYKPKYENDGVLFLSVKDMYAALHIQGTLGSFYTQVSRGPGTTISLHEKTPR